MKIEEFNKLRETIDNLLWKMVKEKITEVELIKYMQEFEVKDGMVTVYFAHRIASPPQYSHGRLIPCEYYTSTTTFTTDEVNERLLWKVMRD